MLHLDEWLKTLLDTIEEAAERDQDFNIYLTKETTKAVAKEWKDTEYFEVY